MENEIASRANNRKESSVHLFFRWPIVLTILLFYLTAPEKAASLNAFLQTFAIYFVYNIILTLYMKSSSSNRRIPTAFVLIDAVALSVFVYQLGGIEADTYILYFFLIGVCGVYGGINTSISIGAACLVFFTFASLVRAWNHPEDFNVSRLVLKDFLLVMASCGITFLSHEMRRFNEMHKKEFKLARMDKLTGLANRHYFDQKLREEVEYADLNGKPLNILIFDLDNFKRFNDTYGHVWGDKLLSLFSDIIKQSIRKADIPVRYGGEEFLLLIRDLEIDMAKCVGERIRKNLEKQRIYAGNEDDRRKVTVSCGVAQYPRHASDIKQAIELADKALYYAKESGKNRVVSYDEMLAAIGE